MWRKAVAALILSCLPELLHISYGEIVLPELKLMPDMVANSVSRVEQADRIFGRRLKCRSYSAEQWLGIENEVAMVVHQGKRNPRNFGENGNSRYSKSSA